MGRAFKIGHLGVGMHPGIRPAGSCQGYLLTCHGQDGLFDFFLDGAVIFLNDDDQWTVRIEKAALFDKDKGEAVLEAMGSRANEYADLYLIDVGEEGLPAGRERLRETIRTLGPSIRTDLGYQAEA